MNELQQEKRSRPGDPDGTLTHDTQNRNLMLYTTELRGREAGRTGVSRYIVTSV